MGFFEDVYQKLFEKKSSSGIISFEVIKRSKTFNEDFERWKESLECKNFIVDIRQGYELKKKGIDQSLPIHLLNSKYAKGIAISQIADIDKKSLQYLLDLLAERVVTLGYKMANSDEIIRDQGSYMESVEKRYLKPKSNTEIADQKFGNVLLEYICIDNKPSHLKLTANVYSDQKFGKPEEFDSLLKKILI